MVKKEGRKHEKDPSLTHTAGRGRHDNFSAGRLRPVTGAGRYYGSGYDGCAGNHGGGHDDNGSRDDGSGDNHHDDSRYDNDGCRHDNHHGGAGDGSPGGGSDGQVHPYLAGTHADDGAVRRVDRTDIRF